MKVSWTEKELPQRLRTKHVHGLHPFLGKFIPQLAELLLQHYFEPGQRVLDPFVGSGTTLVEANVLGIHSVGVDVSEFNCLLAKVKTAKYDLEKLRREIFSILERVKEAPPQPPLANDYLERWYAPKARQELLAYRHLIPEYEYQDVLKVILSRAARSARLAPHHELDWPRKPVQGLYYCHKHRRICHPADEALKFLKRYSRDVYRRIAAFQNLRQEVETEVIWGDSRTIKLEGQFDGILTSPPYAGLIDYHKQHKYAYELLGLKDFSHLEIGRTRSSYVGEMVEVFQNILPHIKLGGVIIIVVNDRFGFYEEILSKVGLAVEKRISRKVDRRTGRRCTGFSEEIIISHRLTRK